uniref:Uncharacterized protein n=1 Tax=viral metagenome TaxID=1070528 RepID=A0A6M3Y077_9ZZZZ
MPYPPNCPVDKIELSYLEEKWRWECLKCKRKWTGETTIPRVRGREDIPMECNIGIIDIANYEEEED